MQWLALMHPVRREILTAGLVLFLVCAVSIAGYMWIEERTLIDAVYMTFITLTTIGFAEVWTLSTAGRVFTIVIALFGIVTVSYIVTRTAQLLLLSQNVRERHMRKQIERLHDHHIICGYGRIGRRIATDLAEAGKPYVVIEQDEAKLEQLLDEHRLYVEGNAEEEKTLIEAGIKRAAGVILTLREDASNVFVTLTARELKPDLLILARTNETKNARKLLHAGANKVISPYDIGADRMAQVILRPNVDRFMEQVLEIGALDLRMEEVTVDAASPLAGKTLAGANFRKQFDTIVVAILPPHGAESHFNPTATTVFDPGAVLIVLGAPADIARLRRVARGEAIRTNGA